MIQALIVDKTHFSSNVEELKFWWCKGKSYPTIICTNRTSVIIKLNTTKSPWVDLPREPDWVGEIRENFLEVESFKLNLER